MTTYAWVLVLWIGSYHGGPATVPSIPTEGDCIYLGNKLVEQWKGMFASGFTCTRYKTLAAGDAK
jgi:hypothetical protein